MKPNREFLERRPAGGIIIIKNTEFATAQLVNLGLWYIIHRHAGKDWLLPRSAN
jgi:hypothetical protein